MNESSVLAQKLLAGKVVCKYSMPSEYEHLSTPSVYEEFNRNFIFLGVKLTETSNKSGFYLTYISNNKGAARDFFKGIMTHMRTTLSWLEIMMEATDRDSLINSGQDISFSNILASVTGNMELQERLNRLPSSKGEIIIKKQLEGLIKYLKKEGVLMDLHTELEIYRFTGMVDLINEYILFIQEAESVPLEELSEKQDRLL